MSFEMDIYGRIRDMPDRYPNMTDPVRCRCGSVYDLGKVEVTGRYADCTMWKTPCCKSTADDRGETGWKSFSDYTPLRRRGGAR